MFTKHKFTFQFIAIALLLCIGMLVAFKHENNSKKYLTISYSIYIGNTKTKYLNVYDEKNKKTEIPTDNSEDDAQVVNKMINEYSAKGYQFVSMNATERVDSKSYYILFEKK